MFFVPLLDYPLWVVNLPPYAFNYFLFIVPHSCNFLLLIIFGFPTHFNLFLFSSLFIYLLV